jgi:hypothetical protein
MRSRKTIWALVAALALACATGAFAQDQKEGNSPIDPNAPLQPLETNPGPNEAGPKGPPIPAGRGVNSPDAELYDPAQVTPDTSTLAGATPFSVGSLQHTRNLFDPAISVSQLGQLVPGATGGSILTGESVATASLNFSRTAGSIHFSALYNGGETFNEGYGRAPDFFGAIAPHYQFHNVTVTEEDIWGRWHILFRNDFTASPGAAFTGQGMGGPGLISEFSSVLGNSLSSFAQVYLPSETINTAQVLRYRESVLGQAEYSLSRRAALTFSGSYGLLHFTQAGYVNSTLVGAQAGYDYEIDPFDSIAVLGSYGMINYSGTSNSTTDYTVELAYGRKVTGRLAFQVAAGPQEIHSSTSSPLGAFTVYFAAVNSALTYRRRRGGLSFNFVRGLTGGSGIFEGATSNTVSAGVQYQFTRNWSGTANAGYAVNNSLAPSGTSSIQFNNWFFGANIGRPLGTRTTINFNYGASDQQNPTVCTLATCGGNGLQESVGVSLNFHFLPLGERRQ